MRCQCLLANELIQFGYGHALARNPVLRLGFNLSR